MRSKNKELSNASDWGVEMIGVDGRLIRGLGGGLVALLATVAAASDEEQLERPPVLLASEVLPAQLRAGEQFEVAEEVANDGYMNRFLLRTDYGDFLVYGRAMLEVRVHELRALAELAELSNARVFRDAVVSGALGQVTTIVELGKRPVSTVAGIPAGVGRMFARYWGYAKEGLEDVEGLVAGGRGGKEPGEEPDAAAKTKKALDSTISLAERYLGVTAAQRRWAEKLGVDPYTSNEVLLKALERVVWVEKAAGLGVELLEIPQVEGVGYIEDANALVWGRDPLELRKLNEGRLRQAGADDELVDAFFRNESLSPTMRTRLAGLIDRLSEVSGRASVLERAVAVESEEQAWFLAQSMAMVEWFHAHESPLVRLLPGKGVPAAVARDGRLVVLAAVDHLCWTEDVAALARERVAQLASEEAGRRELWLLGSVSDRCRAELGGLGWRVRDRLGTTLMISVSARPIDEPKESEVAVVDDED